MQVEELLKPFPIKEFHPFPRALMGPGAHEIIGPEALIGNGATVQDGAVIGARALVAAGSTVTPGTVVAPETVVTGTPAKLRGPLEGTAKFWVDNNPEVYRELARRHALGVEPVPLP